MGVRILAHIEGHLKGLHTVISNLEDLAREMSRPPAYVLKFLGHELGDIITKGDRVNHRWLVNGVHSPQKLEQLVAAFVSQFVRCGFCGSTNTVLFVNTKKDPPSVSWMCRETGCCEQTYLDPGSPLFGFIVKHPPIGDDGAVFETPRRLRLK